MNKFVARLANRIADMNPDADDKTRSSIAYGLSVLWNDIVKIPLVFVLVSIVFSAWEMLVSLLFWGPLRIWLGGLHSKTWLGCLVTTCCCFLTIHGVARYTAIGTEVLLGLVVVGGLFVLLFAPVDHPNKPIKSEKQRKRMKWTGLSVYSAEALIASLLSPEAGRIGYCTLLVVVGLMLSGLIFNTRKASSRGLSVFLFIPFSVLLLSFLPIASIGLIL